MTTAERAIELRKRLFPIETEQTPVIAQTIASIEHDIKAALDTVIAAEREACARVADGDLATNFLSCSCRLDIAAEIRKRGET